MDEDFAGKEALLGVPRVAAYLGVSEVTVYRWCREGRLPCLKIGRTWRIRRGALEDFLERSERSATLVGQMRSFLRVPDNVLGIAQKLELLWRLDAAFFRVGEARGGTMVKFYGARTRTSVDELRSRMEDEGLDVGRLENEGRFRFVEERYPPGDRTEALRPLLAEETEEGGRTLWASFDWTKDVELDAALERQDALTQFVEGRHVAVITAMLEEESDVWPPAAQRRMTTLHSGTVLLSERDLVLSRKTPLSET